MRRVRVSEPARLIRRELEQHPALFNFLSGIIFTDGYTVDGAGPYRVVKWKN